MLQYTVDQLLSLRRYDVTPPRTARKAIFSHRLWRPAVQRRWNSTSRDGISYVLSTNNDQLRTGHVKSRAALSTLTFGCLNVQSLLNKYDDVVELCRDNDRPIDLLCLTESWHDADSAVLGRLRCSGYNVVDRPRPRVAGTDDMSVNHGGVVIMAAGDVSLSPIAVVSQPSTFEVVCARAVVRQFSAIVVLVYRPGSAAIQQSFFDELAAVLDRVAVYQEPIYVMGDFNVRLDRDDDPHADQLRLLVDCYGLTLHDTEPTHRLGGTLDVVITHNSTGCPDHVAVKDVGLSDHFLLSWEVSTARAAPLSVPVCSRPWRRLDIEQFRAALSSSRLCRPDDWPADIDAMASLYDDELNILLDKCVPVRQFVRRPRPSDPWFDSECLQSKRLTRRLERASAAASHWAAAASPNDGTAAAKATAAKDAWYEQRREYRRLRHRKSFEFWRSKLEADQFDPGKLWKSVDVLLGRGRIPASSHIDVETFNRFFVDKVEKVRSNTKDAPPPTFSRVRSGVSFTTFSPLTIDDVIAAVRRLPDKSSAADSIPTNVLKQVADLLAPFLVELFNCSLNAGHFPDVFRHAFVTPVVKKPGLDTSAASSYRPISNLSVLSKLLERLVVYQLLNYLTSADLLSSLQSGYRAGHSTETAVLRVLSDILRAVDSGDVAALVLLDLSAAFDTVDHDILLKRLQATFGITDVAHRWIRSYLSGRTQRVRHGANISSITRLLCGVPQGSVLGPILFVLYTVDLIPLIQSHGLSAHLYADDTQVYGSCRPVDVVSFSSDLSRCVDETSGWMKSNRLQSNPDKAEVLWCTTSRRQHQLPTTPLSIDGAAVDPAKSVRDLGIYIDSDLVMRTHVQRTVSRCFSALRQLRQIRRSVPPDTFQSLIVSLVISRLDYGNAVLVGLPVYLVRRLQSVLNAAARLIYHMRSADHITDALISLHWLRVPQRIDYKVAVLTYKVLHGSAPRYLGPLVPVADLPGRRALRSAGTNRLSVPSVRLSTVGSRAFEVAAPRIWNALPEETTSAQSLMAFRRQLKSYLFQRSYPDVII